MSVRVPMRIRHAGADDVSLVTSSWLESAREEGDAKWMPNGVYFALRRPRMVEILDRAEVLVACNPDDEWHVYGWIAYEPGVLHYAYTKLVFRRMGVFDRLYDVAERPRIATSVGYLFGRLRDKYRLVFDPRGRDGSA